MMNIPTHELVEAIKEGKLWVPCGNGIGYEVGINSFRGIEGGPVNPILGQGDVVMDREVSKLHITGINGVMEDFIFMLKESSKFYLPVKVEPDFRKDKIVSAQEIVGEEIIESVKAMREMDLLNLPNPIVTLYIPTEIKNDKNKSVPNFLFIFCQVKDQPITGRIFYRYNDYNNKLWGHIPGIRKFFVEEDVSEIKRETTSNYIEFYQLYRSFVNDDLMCLLETTMCATLMMLITYIRTKGIGTEYVPPPDKLNKIRLKKRKEPIDGFTKVVIRENRAKGEGSPRGPVEERKRTRLHIRRGHIRNQRYGVGFKYTRQVWIDPVLVGYEEEGRIYHEYELQPE